MEIGKRAARAYRQTMKGNVGEEETADGLLKSPDTVPIRSGSGNRAASRPAEKAPPRSDTPPAPDTLLAPASPPETSGSYIKVAKFLAVLGRGEAAAVLEHFSETERDRILNALAHIEAVPPREARKLLTEFGARTRDVSRPSSGGPEAARDILVRAFGITEGERAFYRILPELKPGYFTFLTSLSDQQLYALVGKESPSAIALVLAHCARETAAHILSVLPSEHKADVVTRIARMEKVDISVVRAVEEHLHDRLEHAAVAGSEEIDGAGRLAEILRHMDLTREDEILAVLREEDEALSDRVRNRLTTVDDMLRVPDRDLQRVLQRIDDTDISIFLKGRRSEIVDKIRSNMSERRWEMVEMNRESLGPMKRRDVDRVAGDILILIRKMVQDGEISMLLPGEEYV